MAARTQQYPNGQDDPWRFSESFEMHVRDACKDYPEGLSEA